MVFPSCKQRLFLLLICTRPLLPWLNIPINHTISHINSNSREQYGILVATSHFDEDWRRKNVAYVMLRHSIAWWALELPFERTAAAQSESRSPDWCSLSQMRTSIRPVSLMWRDVCSRGCAKIDEIQSKAATELTTKSGICGIFWHEKSMLHRKRQVRHRRQKFIGPSIQFTI